MKRTYCLLQLVFLFSLFGIAAPQVRYTGATLSNPYLHDGGLTPIIGTHNRQIMRAHRERPDTAHCLGWTYNHQPMMAYWHGRFYVHFLSDPRSEHVPPSVTWLMTSADGRQWSQPEILFPEYDVPEGFSKVGVDQTAHQLKAVMHQRVGFYVSSAQSGGKLLAIGNYGICLHDKDDPNDGNGIGRVVRELHDDGTMGDIYFLYYNHNFNEKNTAYPNYRKSKDRRFVAACREILDNPLYWMQWVEEADRNDPHLPVKNIYKAFCYYPLAGDTTLVAFWKHALTSTSHDGGRTWNQPIGRAPGFVNSNAKIWGQRLSDGTYATVYNPAEFRWPLALSTSIDGQNYTTLHLVHGEITPMRYGGNYKSYGPQYVRGILPGNGCPPDSNLWVTYSVNKEDIWVSRVPVPIRTQATAHADDDFAAATETGKTPSDGDVLDRWNIYSCVDAPVEIRKGWLTLSDSDLWDYAKAERIIPAGRRLTTSFDLRAGQNDHGTLQVEWLDDHGTPCSRLEWKGDESLLRVKVGARYNTVMKHFEAGRTYHVETLIDLDSRNITVWIDGKKYGPKMLFAPIAAISRVSFRTGDRRSFPTPETPADNDTDLDHAGDGEPAAVWQINHFRTAPTPADARPYGAAYLPAAPYALLDFADVRPLIDYFNGMEDENIVTTIANADAADWMAANVPLFDCPDRDMTEMYYYRWWTLRKHIKRTPVGYAMTEFLVERSYADQYNLIACALGHHIMESRWLRDSCYLNQIVGTWLRGNAGGPMKRIDTFSSWLPYALMCRTAVTADSATLIDLRPDLEADFARWDSTNRMPDGLYWQKDVKDGMEESISGGRKVKNRRPSINSYMYGNARALAALLDMEADALPAGQSETAKTLHQRAEYYNRRADTLQNLIDTKLWNPKHHFYETLTEADTLMPVREAIGFLPWYFNMPADHAERATAWQQLTDPKGFAAPFGLTTAERRHPKFRSHGVGRCEWDGAIWPFATAQTLTALANYCNNYQGSAALQDSVFFDQMQRYTESQHRRGRPYIGEYLDETHGQWLMGDRERSRYYNHSTYNDLIISGLVGLRPSLSDTLVVNPLLPAGRWSWFCLDGVAYHGRLITIIWDADGSHYRQGRGLTVLVDGIRRAHRHDLGRIECRL